MAYLGDKKISLGAVVTQPVECLEKDKFYTKEECDAKFGKNYDEDIKNLYAITAQSGLYAMMEIEQAFRSRITANGENIVDGATASVKRIQGSTVIDEVGHLRHASFCGLRVTGKNILRPLSQRVYRSVGDSANTNPRYWDGKTCTYKMNVGGTFTDELSACKVDKENGTITCNFNSDSNGFAMDYPCQSGLWYTCSFKDTQNRAKIRMCFYTKEGTVISGGSGANSNWFCMRAPENAVWGIFIVTASTANLGETTYSEFMVEVSTAQKTAPSEYEPFVETEIGDGTHYDLPAYDYIDLERQVYVHKTGEATSAHSFTEEQLAQYKNYIQALNRMELVYEMDEAIEIPIEMPKEYVAHKQGTETFVPMGGLDYAIPVFTIEYFKLLGGK